MPGIDGAVDHLQPVIEIRRSGFVFQAKALDDDVIQAFLIQHVRDIVDAVPGIQRGNHGLARHIGKQGDLGAFGFG